MICLLVESLSADPVVDRLKASGQTKGAIIARLKVACQPTLNLIAPISILLPPMREVHVHPQSPRSARLFCAFLVLNGERQSYRVSTFQGAYLTDVPSLSA